MQRKGQAFGRNRRGPFLLRLLPSGLWVGMNVVFPVPAFSRPRDGVPWELHRHLPPAKFCHKADRPAQVDQWARALLLSACPVSLRRLCQLPLAPPQGNSSQLESKWSCRKISCWQIYTLEALVQWIPTKLLQSTHRETEAWKITPKVRLPCEQESWFCSRFPVSSKQRTFGVYCEHETFLEISGPPGEGSGVSKLCPFVPSSGTKPTSFCLSFFCLFSG